ncbi:MAG: diguanylate cyclase [Lachnospiraceae bacterium]|nr:diguanylate cyclase [Lachnospiraceae bacterium]
MKAKGLYRKLLNTAVVPVVVLGLVITFFCYFRFTGTIYDEARENMRNIAKEVIIAYDKVYDGDYNLQKNEGDTYDLYKGETEITQDYSIVDSLSEATGVEISLLYLDVRIHTTFESKGTRLAGISVNPATSSTVLDQEKEAFYRNVQIIDSKYLVLYVPVRNSHGSVIGMVEIAKSQASLNASVLRAVWPILLLIVLGVALAAWIAYKSTRNITDDIRALQQFLNKVEGGTLSVEMDPKLLGRDDEIGDISKSSVAMAKSIRAFIGTDPLTKLYNRRYVMEALGKIKERSASTGQPYCLAIADIDFFKKVNDTYGHNAGDDVLKSIAGILNGEMAGKGFAARWGGEEFILVFNKMDTTAAEPHLWKALERIRANVVETEGFSIKVTMTFGLSEGTQGTIEEIVAVSDEKLYYGKQHGRNQVVNVMPAPEAPAEEESAVPTESTPSNTERTGQEENENAEKKEV